MLEFAATMPSNPFGATVLLDINASLWSYEV
jgi:hypothetical protein